MGSTTENYQIRDIADMVREIVPGCSVRYAEGGGPDPRCYRVNCDRITAALPSFRPEWTVRRGVAELYEHFARHGLTREQFSHFVRLKRIQDLQRGGRLDVALRWQTTVMA